MDGGSQSPERGSRWAAGSPASSGGTRARSSRCCCRGRSAGWSWPTWARSPCCSWRRFWQLDTFSGQIVHETGSQNFKTIGGDAGLPTIAARTVGIAAAVTVTDALLAFPIAFYMAKVATPAGARPARGGRADAAVVELPREGLLVADHAAGDGDRELGTRALRTQRPGVRQRGHLARVLLPLAAVHGACRSTPGSSAFPHSLLDASGDLGGGPWTDVPAGGAAARIPGGGGRLHLHLLADSRRLHHAHARVEHAVHRQRRLQQRRRRQQPAAGRRVRHRAGVDHGRVPADRPATRAPSRTL